MASFSLTPSTSVNPPVASAMQCRQSSRQIAKILKNTRAASPSAPSIDDDAIAAKVPPLSISIADDVLVENPSTARVTLTIGIFEVFQDFGGIGDGCGAACYGEAYFG